MLTRRVFLQGAAASPVLAAGSAFARDTGAPALKSLTGDAKPISVEERHARIAKSTVAHGAAQGRGAID